MEIGIPKEIAPGETRVAATPETVAKLVQAGFVVLVERGAGEAARFRDEDYAAAGARLGDHREALGAPVVFKVNKPRPEEIALMRRGAVLIALLDMCHDDGTFARLAAQGVEAYALEMIPRLSRAQSMDVLTSQANIAGYRAVIEAARLYERFFPMMVTAAGTVRAANVIVLGAGVAGLQAIATARRLGAKVSAYDVRPEVKEQVQSLGARFIELDLGESGAGEGGYARALSSEAQRRQQQQLAAQLAQADVVISTALVPCMPAPVLITEEAVRGMHEGAVIVDMAAASGGNCPLTEPDRITVKHGVILCGITNFPALMPTEASRFFARNVMHFLFHMLEKGPDGGWRFKDPYADEITRRTLITHAGAVVFEGARPAKQSRGGA